MSGEQTETTRVVKSIELDCPPGAPRPSDLIASVIEGTGLELPAEHPQPFFGHATYWFEEVSDEDWVNRVKPITKPRIEALYHAGVIRYGSW